MTEREFTSRTHFMMDSIGLIPARQASKNKARVIPAGQDRALLELLAQLSKPPVVACKDESLDRLDQTIDELSRAAELNGRITAARNRPIPDAEGAGPSAFELMAQYQPAAGEMAAQYAINMARACAESEARYAARNPHKKKSVGLYENEEAVTKPMKDSRAVDTARLSTFEARCRASEAAYAARNPHKKARKA